MTPPRWSSRSLFTLIDPDDRARAEAFFREATPRARRQRPGRVALPAARRVAPLHAEVIATNLLGDPIVSGIVLNTRDVSERKRFEQQLLHQAFHDPLTGLANRALFRDRVDHALKLAKRQRHAITVLFLDLDDFKKVNDSFGHGEGDKLLVLAAERFRSCARAADTVARLGGDEFAILIEDSTGPEEQQALIERLTSSMAQPVHAERQRGVRHRQRRHRRRRRPARRVSEVLRNADTAMYAAKRAGKGRFEAYASQMSSDVRHRLELERALRRALEKGELVLHYQPIVSLADRHHDRRRGAGALGAPAVRPPAARSTSSRSPRRPGSLPASAAGCCTRPAARSGAGAASTPPSGSRWR